MPSRVYLSPGMFGFARLASFDYFGHVARAIEERFAAHGKSAAVRVCEVQPTASIRRRALALARLIDSTCEPDAPIHLVGHSTGGLDARLLASPTVSLAHDDDGVRTWAPRIASITSMNTPHYGTPLATFFATVSGQRMLMVLSALTVIALKLGAPPLTILSAIARAFGRIELAGMEVQLFEPTVEGIVKLLDEASSRELRAWLRQIRDDQGGIVQIMPEAMDVFDAGIEDRPGVRYQCVAGYAPPNGAVDWVRTLGSPVRATSAVLFTALATITSRQQTRYPCALAGDDAKNRIFAMLGESPPLTANDGIVPLYSQIHGELVWVGRADHLDVVGHFPGPGGHSDWLSSGARFNRVRFDVMMDRVVAGMLASEARGDAPSRAPRRATVDA